MMSIFRGMEMMVDGKHMTAYLSEKRQPFLLRRHLNWLGKNAWKNLRGTQNATQN